MKLPQNLSKLLIMKVQSHKIAVGIIANAKYLLTTPRPIEFKYKVVHHEKDLSNLKVDPLRVPKK